tara:strand:- start:51 stop:3896 length:3846 start_codon:yes stop_codon:yes gene_type:complete
VADESPVTYESLQNNKNFLAAAYHSLRSLGEQDLTEDPKDIIDTFLTKRRYFDINLGSTIVQGNNIINLPKDYQKLYSYAADQIKKMPMAGKEGGADLGPAVVDYALGGLSDPTNLVSIIAGLFTGGTGSLALQAGKETVKRGIMAKIKSMIGESAISKYGKMIAVEGTIAGVGGGAQQVQSQNVDMALGKQKETGSLFGLGDYDYGKIGLQALLEGTLSPIAGIAMGKAGRGVQKASKKIGLTDAIRKSVEIAVSPLIKKTSKNSQVISDVTNILRNNLVPLSSLDEVSVRLTERSTGETRPIQEAVEELALKMDDRLKAKFTDEADMQLVNKAMEGDPKALAKVKKIDPEMETILNDWRGYVSEAQQTAMGASYLSKKVRGIYKPKKNTPYVRDIYEKFEKVERRKLKDFLALPQNKNLTEEVFEAVKSNKKNWGTDSGLFNEKGMPTYKTEEDRVNTLKRFMGELYGEDPTKRKKRGALKAKKDIPDSIKKVFGYNFSPAVRALETAKGVIDSSNRIRLGSSLADSLVSRDMAIKADSSDVASRLFSEKTGTPEQEMVPLATYLDPKENKVVNELSPFVFRKDLVDAELYKIYVPKNKASLLKELSQGFDGRFFKDEDSKFKDVIDLFSGVQGYIKKNKTVYSLNAHARNALGAVQYTIGSGNGMGIVDGYRFWKNATPERRKEINDTLSKLGLKGSQVEINQIMSRIGDLDMSKDKTKIRELILNATTFGVPALEKTRIGKKVSKFAQKVYVATDDLGKIASYFRERKRTENIWNGRSDEQKNLLRERFTKEFNIDPKSKNFDSKLLDEAAVQKTMNILPVYSRIPRILEKMRGFPLVGSFTAFPAENLRNKYNLFKLAGEEIREGALTNNSALLRAGGQRLASQLAIASAPSIAAYTYNSLQGTSNMENAVRKAGSPWSKNHANAIRNDKKTGKYYTTDLSYNNPDQFSLDMIMPFMIDAFNGKDLTKNLDKIFTDIAAAQVEPFLGPSLAFQVGRFTVDAVKGMNNNNDEDTVKSLIKAYKIMEPGLVQMAREAGTDLGMFNTKLASDIPLPEALGGSVSGLERLLNPLYFGEERSRFSDTNDLNDYLARLGPNWNYGIGLAPWSFASKEKEFNPKKNFAFGTRTVMKNADNDFDTNKTKIKNTLIDPSLPINYKHILTMYDDMLSEQFEAHKNVASLISSYMEFMKPLEIKKMLGDKVIAGPLSKNGITGLLSNMYIPSDGKLLSRSKEMLATIRRKNPSIDLPALVALFRQVERDYLRRSLSEDVPEELEVED